jgi:O-antigen/teichoic acid export membrane protein
MEALHAWHEFYILLGTAAATLIALLFVAVSLGSGYLTGRRRHLQGTRTFMSPVVIHFTSVFFISAVCLVPSHGPVFFSVLIGVTALIGYRSSSPCGSCARR